MNALTYDRYGMSDVLAFRDLPKPGLEPGRVLIKVHAASVNPLDWRLMKADPFLVRLGNGIFRPKLGRLGADFSGVVDSVAEDVSSFQPGDAVFGLMTPKLVGSFAEYISIPEEALVRKPESVTHRDASTLGVAALTAYQGIHDYRKLTNQDRVLINGASGGIGTFAIQMAKALGAHVTAVSSGRNHDLVKSLGADAVIDYRVTDLLEIDERYDLVFDLIGTHPHKKMAHLLHKDGKLVFASAGSGWGFLKVMMAAKKHPSVELIIDLKKDASRIQHVLDLLTKGKIKPVIDREYAFEESADAIDYVATKRARGKVVINISSTE